MEILELENIEAAKEYAKQIGATYRGRFVE